MLIDKTIKVPKSVDELASQLVIVVQSLKGGQSLSQVALGEVLKLQSLIADVQALPQDFSDYFAPALKALLCSAADLTAALLGKDAQPL